MDLNGIKPIVVFQVKTEFLQLWDGLIATTGIIVVGTTNRPNRLSDATWRRFGRHFEVRATLVLPDACACRHSYCVNES